MDKRELDALIERVEGLDGPSREVEAGIAAILHPTDDPRYEAFISGRDYPDLYTTSLDAAIALCERVLPDVYYGVERTGLYPGMIPGSPDKKFKAEVGDWGTPCRAYADTPALALVLATLRALGRDG